jgi:hypothetical protein
MTQIHKTIILNAANHNAACADFASAGRQNGHGLQARAGETSTVGILRRFSPFQTETVGILRRFLLFQTETVGILRRFLIFQSAPVGILRRFLIFQSAPVGILRRFLIFESAPVGIRTGFRWRGLAARAFMSAIGHGLQVRASGDDSYRLRPRRSES